MHQVIWMVVAVRGRHIEMLILTNSVVVIAYSALIWFDSVGETFGSLVDITIVLSIIMMAPPVILAIFTLQVPILKRSLFRFDFFFHQWNAMLVGVWHSICYQGSVWHKGLVVFNFIFVGGFVMGACHAFQLRRWVLIGMEFGVCVACLLCALSVIASPAAFKDVRTDFGVLPFQVSGLTQLTSSCLLCALFTSKEFVRLWRSPGHAPPGLRGIVKLKWVEPGSVQEERMSGGENGKKPSPPLGGVSRTDAELCSGLVTV
jgi:hypothetical protein